MKLEGVDVSGCFLFAHALRTFACYLTLASLRGPAHLSKPKGGGVIGDPPKEPSISREQVDIFSRGFLFHSQEEFPDWTVCEIFA
mgnify:CR=1 FL=1